MSIRIARRTDEVAQFAASGAFTGLPATAAVLPSPSPISSCLQAFAAGLRPEAAAFAAGRNDGAKGADFRPLDDWSPERLQAAVNSGDQATMSIVLNYALGFQAAGGSISKGARHALRSH